LPASGWANGRMASNAGCRVAEVRTGSGLTFSVLLDRGMDIGPAAYKGLPLAWVSPTGWRIRCTLIRRGMAGCALLVQAADRLRADIPGAGGRR